MSEKNQGFTIVKNEIINSGKISLKAMGLFLYLKSKPKDWKFSTLRITKEFPDGIHSVRCAMKELEEHNLIERRKLQNEKGQFQVEYFFKDETVLENPTTEKPKSEKPTTEKIISEEKPKQKTEVRKTNVGKTDDGKKDNNKNTIKTKKEEPKKEEEIPTSDGSLFPEEPKKENSKLYTKMVDIYFEWFKGLSGVNPNFNASEGKAMKLMINYFKVLHKEANDGTNEEEEVQKMFIFILKNWHLTDAFLQKQTKLTQINSNLQNIINDIKNGHKRKQQSNSKDKSADARSARLQNAFSRIDEMLSNKR